MGLLQVRPNSACQPLHSFAIVDHLHCDPALVSSLYVEILTNYNALVEGKPPVTFPPAASHEEFCTRERQRADAMTLDSSEVRKWIEFAENNGGGMPEFPLPLGDQSVHCGGDIIVERLMGPEQTAKFEANCVAAGARFSGGLFTCAALAHYELTGQANYYGLTPWISGVFPLNT